MVKKSLLKTLLAYGVVTSSLVMPGHAMAENNLPFYYKFSRNEQENKFIVGYRGNIELPKGFSLECFGEVNLSPKEGATWNSGKIKLKKPFKKWKGIYDINLKKNGKFIPKLEHLIQIRIDF